mgnify:CR=1 FL=1
MKISIFGENFAPWRKFLFFEENIDFYRQTLYFPQKVGYFQKKNIKISVFFTNDNLRVKLFWIFFKIIKTINFQLIINSLIIKKTDFAVLILINFFYYFIYYFLKYNILKYFY